MPFNSQAYLFNAATLNTVKEIGGVYGLFVQSAGRYQALYVGLSDNLRRRLNEHYNNPPVRGTTHFFAEVITNAAQRTAREQALIREFNPPGNVHHTR